MKLHEIGQKKGRFLKLGEIRKRRGIREVRRNKTKGGRFLPIRKKGGEIREI